MNLDNNLLFFFSSLGAFNSVVLSIYFLLLKKGKSASDTYLGALLAVLSIRVWKSIFFYFNPDLSKVYLQIGLSACLFIGPFLYFFLATKLASIKQRKPHFVVQLVFLFLVVVTVGFLYPYETNPDLWGTLFYKVINYLWLFYILAALPLVTSIFTGKSLAGIRLAYDEVYALSVYVGVLFIWLAYFFASYTSYIMGAITFSFSIYLSLLVIFFKRKPMTEAPNKKERYANTKIDDEDARELLAKINQVMVDKVLYKNPNLTLTILAKELNTRPHLISQLLNDNLQKNFPLFINEFRVNEAIRFLESENNLKIEAIAEMCGFNSTSTFYSTFKKITGTTPSKYLSSSK